MSTADQLLLARISGICSRHCARGEIDDLDAAVAELQEAAGHRPDLLAQHAGACLGLAEKESPLVAPRYRAEAGLATAAGADEELIGRWIDVGRRRAAQKRFRPYTG
jgi:hypothetical protein